jgi:putative transposase
MDLIEYIKNQENHHEKKSFKEEYIGFLKKYDIEYDERYIFNDY